MRNRDFVKQRSKPKRIPRTIKTMGFLFMAGCMHLSASNYSQSIKLNLNLKNATLSDLFEAIEEQSEFLVYLKDKNINLKERVSIDASGASVEAILEKTVGSKGLTYEVIDKQITIVPVVKLASQKSQKIKGTIVDQNGEPIIGATIIEEGTTNGTTTDFDGQFSIDISVGGTLKISYIGYTTKYIKPGNQDVLKISLIEDTKQLDEVVIVGFGTQKKVNLTGSVGTVDVEALESRPVVNATQALQGLVPGLQISTSGGSLETKSSINVRGVGTIGEGSSGSPLILIDGMEGDINSINPQDIENISVLKDAASSSIYGSRAPFGVILVTTKRGKTGKASINYNNNFRWNDPIKMPKQMDSYTFATFYNDGRVNAGQSPFFTTEHLQRIKDYQSGVLNNPVPANGNFWADGYNAGNANTDWYDAIYRNWAFSQEHNFSINGGSEKVTYYLSFNYLDQNGLMEFNQDDYNRYTATGKINAQLTDWAAVNYSSRFTREDYGRPSRMTNGLYSDLARQGWPTLPLYDLNGYLYSSPSPALGLRDGGRDKSQTDNIYQQISFRLEPIKNWVTNVDFNYKIYSANRHWDSQVLYNHDVNGVPYVFDSSSNVHEDHYKDNFLNFNVYTDYFYSLESGHNFKGMLGFQCERLSNTKFGLQRNGIIVPGLPEVDITTGLDYYGNPITPSVNGSRANWSTAGFFGRINYDYDGKYLAEVNLRYDGTSRFRSNKRWNWFPSFSLGWNVAREHFWEELAQYVETLKLRGSYGELGNQNTNSWYPTYPVLSVNPGSGSWIQNGLRPNVAYVPGLISSTLGWEKVRNWNIGLDFGAFNNRLTGSFDYYKRMTLNMIGPAPELPGILGLDVPKTNNTDLETYGFDFNIGWNDRLSNGFSYGAKFILSDAQTKITRYPNPTETLSKYNAGRNMNEIWGYETVGLATSQEQMDQHLVSLPNGGQNALGTNWSAGDIMYKDLNGDGKIDNGANKLNEHGDLKLIGNSTPRYQFGLDLNAAWKGLDLRVFFQGVMKRDYWQESAYFWGINGGIWHSTGFVEHTDYFRAIASNDLPANLNGYYPRPIFEDGKNLQTQTRYLQDASYIRLKNLQLGYTIPDVITSKWAISKLRFFVSGENLWTGTKLAKMFDPETVSGGSDGNGNAYPLSKTISLGLNVTF